MIVLGNSSTGSCFLNYAPLLIFSKDWRISLKKQQLKALLMATMNISLPDQMKSWIDQHVQSGSYANASDYVRDLIRRDNVKRETLCQALIEGEQSGEPKPFDSAEFKTHLHQKHLT